MQKVDRPVGKSRGEYVKTIYKEEHCMRRGMYGKLTMLAVAGVMALSGCGNSGGDTGTAAEPKDGFSGDGDGKGVRGSQPGGEGAVHWADGYYFCQHQRYPVHGSPGGSGFSVCNAEPPHL